MTDGPKVVEGAFGKKRNRASIMFADVEKAVAELEEAFPDKDMEATVVLYVEGVVFEVMSNCDRADSVNMLLDMAKWQVLSSSLGYQEEEDGDETLH